MRKIEHNIDNANKYNCRKLHNCPLQNKYLTNSLVYLDTVYTIEIPGLKRSLYTERHFKTRLYQYNISFTNRVYKNKSLLSKYFWKLKDGNKTPTLKWKIL